MKKIFTIFFLFILSIANASNRLFDFLNKYSPQTVSSVLLIFYKDDCPYCQNMSNILKKETAFTYLLQQNYNIRKVDVKTEEGRALAEKFNVHAVPTIINYDSKTSSYNSIKGFPGINKLASILKLQYIQAQEIKVLQKNNTYGTCGDNIVEPGEDCDDGNLTNGDGCDANCTVTGCGNGIQTAGESCDDGNIISGDGCDGNCTVTSCGNGVITAGESCDDGNITSGDGCDGNCTVTSCGNGVITAGESCDDGNLVDGDGCDANCTISACGNGIVAGVEVCDDGNSVSGDGCDANCTITACGNGIVAGTEACDDGNITNGDGCSSSCTVEYAISTNGVSINADGSESHPSAMLDVKSTDKGLLIPRMTSVQRSAIASPVKGLMVFDITSNTFWYYKATSEGWVEIGGSFNTGFNVFNGSSQNFSADFNPVFTNEQYDDGNNFSYSVFTIPTEGVYDLKTFATFTLTDVTEQTTLTLIIGNTSTSTEYGSNSIIIPEGYSGTVKLQTTANSKLSGSVPVGVRVLVSGNAGTQTLSAITFTGFKVY